MKLDSELSGGFLVVLAVWIVVFLTGRGGVTKWTGLLDTSCIYLAGGERLCFVRGAASGPSPSVDSTNIHFRSIAKLKSLKV